MTDYAARAPTPPEGPFDLSEAVEGEGPLELDIGFGRGRSLLERARQAPERRILGVEIKTKWSALVEERRIREGLTNARAVCADVRELLARSGPDGCLARVYVHFPDPWWKKRHRKRRVVGPALLDELARLMAPDGELFVQTDVEDRAADYRAEVEAHPAFALTHPGFLDSNPYTARSNREVRADEDGLPVYRFVARRRG
jgi:tRNA (guanine-N7-)-methyltransferase